MHSALKYASVAIALALILVLGGLLKGVPQVMAEPAAASGAAAKTNSNPLVGSWLGFIMERDKKHWFEIALREDKGVLKGIFTMVSGLAHDVPKGADRPLAKIRQTGPRIEFLVLLSGKEDADSLHFDLTLDQGRLKGFTYELRNSDKKFDLLLQRRQ